MSQTTLISQLLRVLLSNFSHTTDHRSIMKALGCDSTDAKQALLACLKFQHFDDEVPEQQSVMIKDGKLRLFVK